MNHQRIHRAVKLVSASTLMLGMLSWGVGLASSASATTATPGVTAKSVTIGATVPLSGIAAGYGEVSAAAAAVFSYVNSKGGINGRKINYLRKDDCYNINALGCTAGTGVTTLSQTQALVTQSHVFADVGSLGTAAQGTVLNYLNQNGVPNLFVNSGSSLWNQPKKYKGLFGFQPSYQAESKVFAYWIKKNEPLAVVGQIGQGDDFGANGLAGLLAAHLPIAKANQLTYDANVTSPTLAAGLIQDISTLKANKVNAVVLDSIPPVTQAILKIAYNLGYSPQWLISSVGADPISVATPLEVGAITLDYFPSTADTANSWNQWVTKVIKRFPAARADFPNYFTGANAGVLDANMLYGASYAVAFCEALKSLGKNVTRAGLLKAMTTVRFATPSQTPLRYSATKHQGLLGGSLAQIIANTNPASNPQYIKLLGNAEYTTGDTSTTPVITAAPIVSPIPGWLS